MSWEPCDKCKGLGKVEKRQMLKPKTNSICAWVLLVVIIIWAYTAICAMNTCNKEPEVKTRQVQYHK